MKVRELIQMMPSIKSPEQMSATIDFLLDCDDISLQDKALFCTGYLMGAAFALSTQVANADDLAAAVPLTAQEILQRQQEWNDRGWFNG